MRCVLFFFFFFIEMQMVRTKNKRGEEWKMSTGGFVIWSTVFRWYLVFRLVEKKTKKYAQYLSYSWFLIHDNHKCVSIFFFYSLIMVFRIAHTIFVWTQPFSQWSNDVRILYKTHIQWTISTQKIIIIKINQTNDLNKIGRQ